MLKHIKELFSYRELLYSITIREIKVRYKQSILGILWAILQPLSLMAVFTIIFSKFAKIPSEGIPYPIFCYAALLPWTFFSTSLSFAIPSLVNNSDLINKIYFPREIFPISSVFAAFIDYAIASSIFFVMMIFYKVQITLGIFLIVIILPIQIILTLGIAFLFSSLNVYYRDVRYAIPLIIQIWMYASPVIYPITMIPEKYRILYMLNPMAGIIDGYRKIILHGVSPDWNYLLLSAGVAIILLTLSYKYFKKVEMVFADII